MRFFYRNEIRKLLANLSADEADASEILVHSLDVVADALFAVAAHHQDLVFQGAFLEEFHQTTLGNLLDLLLIEVRGSLLSFYTSMAKVSAYMRYCITERRESVWIAQRNGRTKNGKDATEPSLLKMFASSGDTKDLVANISQLNIVPVSVSYEWEPCDWMKARELSLTVGGVYHKSENEDLQSIITGIIQPKGDVHFGIGRVVSHEDLEKYDAERDGDFFKWLASLILVCRNDPYFDLRIRS